jgi:hypothetical protein
LVNPASSADKGSLPALTAITVVFCLLFALVPPIISYKFEHARLTSDLRIEALTRARAINALILREPQFWRFMQNELYVVLDYELTDIPVLATRVVYSESKTEAIVAERLEWVAKEGLTLTQSAILYDTGKVVGRIDVLDSS